MRPYSFLHFIMICRSGPATIPNVGTVVVIENRFVLTRNANHKDRDTTFHSEQDVGTQIRPDRGYRSLSAFNKRVAAIAISTIDADQIAIVVNSDVQDTAAGRAESS